MESCIQFLFSLQAHFKHIHRPTSHLSNDEVPWLQTQSFQVFLSSSASVLHANRWRVVHSVGHTWGSLLCRHDSLTACSDNRRQLCRPAGLGDNNGCAALLWKPLLFILFAVFAVLRHQLLVFSTTSMKNASYEGQ
jgi:hypothetical protein